LNKDEKFPPILSFILLILFFISFIILTIFISSWIIESSFLWGVLFLFLFSLFPLLYLFWICKRSENIFLKKNRFKIQLIFMLLISILLGSFFSNIFYPASLPNTITLGPLHHSYSSSNDSLISPNIQFSCSSIKDFKNPVEGDKITCNVKEKGIGDNNSFINRIEFYQGNVTLVYWGNPFKEINFNLKLGEVYKVKAFYSFDEFEYDISLDIFKKIYSPEEYSILRSKRIGLIAAFIIFFMSIFVSFIKNVQEIENNFNKKS